MSGHSKWSTIKRKKGAADAKRGQLFTKIGKALSIASREGGGDPNSNFTLRLIVDKARQSNMPMENIERAIKRGLGEIEGEGVYERGVYGGYGPGGVPVVVDVLTDNKNRTVSDLRMVFEGHGGSTTDASSVLWHFKEKGLVVVKCAKLKKAELFGKEDTEEAVDPDEVMMTVIDVPGVEDVQDGGKDEESGMVVCEVISSSKDLAHVKDGIEKCGYIVSSAEIVRIPDQAQELSASEHGRLDTLIEALEDLDDVENVWTTAKQG